MTQHDTKQTILILGAHGRVGTAAAQAFLAAGWRVKGLARGAKAKSLPAGGRPVEAHAFVAGALTEAARGVDVILHALNPKYTEWRETVLPMTENVIAAAKASDATILVPGNVYNFGYAIPLDADERARRVPSTEKAEIRIALEDSLQQAAMRDGVQSLVLRAGDFFGGTQPESWLDLIILKSLKRDRFTWGGPRNIPHSFAYLPDLARAFVALAEKRRDLPAFDTFHFRGHVLSGEQMKAATERVVGRSLKWGSVNWTLIRLLGLFAPMLREIATMSYLWRTPHSLANGKLTALIGEEPHTPLEAAMRQAIADLRLDRAQPAAPEHRAGTMLAAE